MNLSPIRQTTSKLICLILLLASFTGCGDDPVPTTPETPVDDFDLTPVRWPIVPGIIDEASGIAPSKNMDGYYWTHQDSGRPNSLYLLSGDAKTIREYPVPGAINYDWEDIASGRGPLDGVNYLYIGDIGNNNTPIASENAIYRVQEISSITSVFEQSKVEKIRFVYPDGARDAESLILDPLTRDLYVFSKEVASTSIYRLPYPQSTSNVITAEKLGTISGVNFATSADMSADGSEILVRTYLMTYYWSKKSDETILQCLTRPADRALLVSPEPQGEGVCFDNKVQGFFTISEKGEAASVTLNYYKKK